MQFKAIVQSIILRADNVKSFRFPRPADFTYKAGQYIMVTITRGENIQGKYFSLSSSPTENDFIEFTKSFSSSSETAESELSRALNKMKAGDCVEMSGPYGNFTFEGEYEKICMISRGIGITPLRSICKYCTDIKLDTNIILIYSNCIEKDTIFREDLEQMQKENNTLSIILTPDEPDANLIRNTVPDYMQRVFYTCGPAAAIQSITDSLKSLDVPEKEIKSENFIDVTPFVPSPPDIVKRMLEMANVGSSDIVYDIGCGDGRVLIAAVKDFGAKKAVGFEVISDLYNQALQEVKKQGLEDRISIVNDDIFNSRISEATVITIYLLPSTLEKLKPKLAAELNDGTRIVSHDFEIPGWHFKTFWGTLYSHMLYLYIVPDASIIHDERPSLVWKISFDNQL